MRQRTIQSGGGVLGAAELEAPKAIFPMDGTTYYSRIWFVDGKGRDWMGAVHRRVDGDRWQITYRFRYHAGTASPLDDEKSISQGECSEGTTEAEAIAAMKSAVDMLIEVGYLHGPVHELVVNSADLDVLSRALGREEFTNYLDLASGKPVSRREVEARARRRKGAS